MLWMLIGCGAPGELPQPNPPPDWPLENVHVKATGAVQTDGSGSALGAPAEIPPARVEPPSTEPAATETPADDIATTAPDPEAAAEDEEQDP